MAKRIRFPFPENLLRRLEPQPNGCIYFTGSINRGGYGQVRNGPLLISAHRANYELKVGPIPEGMTLDHECHNADSTCAGGPSCLHRRCVNPKHLAPKTRQANSNASLNSMSAKTHCPQGHPYDEANTKVNVKGSRVCRECAVLSNRRYRAKIRALT